MTLRLERFLDVVDDQKKTELAQLVVFNDKLNTEAKGIFQGETHAGLPIVLPAVRNGICHPSLRFYPDLGITHWDLGPLTLLEQHDLLREVNATPLDLISTFNGVYGRERITNPSLAICVTTFQELLNLSRDLEPIKAELARHLSTNFLKAARAKLIWAQLISQTPGERSQLICQAEDLVYVAGDMEEKIIQQVLNP